MMRTDTELVASLTREVVLVLEDMKKRDGKTVALEKVIEATAWAMLYAIRKREERK